MFSFKPVRKYRKIFRGKPGKTRRKNLSPRPRTTLHLQVFQLLYATYSQAWFKRRISVASNAIPTIDNEVRHLIIFSLNCFRCARPQWRSKPENLLMLLVGFTENFCIYLSGGQRKMYQRLYCTRVGK